MTILVPFDFNRYAAAEKKAADVNMTLKGNPLAPAEPGMGTGHVCKNMRRLEKDAELRTRSHNGAVYAGIMDTRFGG